MQNLIGLDLVRRFDPEQWQALCNIYYTGQALWQLPQQALPDFSIVKLQVRVEAEPPPNVKTT